MSESEYYVRPFRRGDGPRLAEISVRTGDTGADASGQYSSDELLPDVMVLPYAERHPEFVFVADGPNGAVGYLVAAPDTEDFSEWFQASWWSTRRPRYVSDAGIIDARDADLVAYADARRPGNNPHAAAYPAHVHIDLLPESQGQGFGRKLVDALIERLRQDRVAGVHLVAEAANATAVAFYPRLGFEPLASGEGEQAFGKKI